MWPHCFHTEGSTISQMAISESLQGAHLSCPLSYGTYGKGGSLGNCKIADPFGMPASSRGIDSVTGKDPKGHLFQLLLCPQPAGGLGGLPVVPALSF